MWTSFGADGAVTESEIAIVRLGRFRLRRLQGHGGGGPGHGEDEGGGGQPEVGERAEAGHGDLFQQEIHPLPEVALA